MTTTTLTAETATGWLAGRLPDDWFENEPTVTIDRDEILVVGTLSDPELAADATEADRAAARAGRARQFREDTRSRRMEIANELEHATRRKVAWGVEVGDEREVFTSLAAPVMTRLRQPERQVLDTLVDSGVARSRSDALGWCVRLVAQHSHDWLDELRQALQQVEHVRATGPEA